MNNGINNYINSMNQAGSTATNSTGKDTLLSSGAKNALALGNSNAGDVVTGEVVAVKDKTVQIQLDNQRIITARLENKMEVAIGQSLAFEVKSNANGQITLSPLFTNTTMNPAMIKAITQASLPLCESTINMTSTMMDNNLGIDRNSMQMMYALINEYPDADPSNLVSMKSLDIPISQENIIQFAAYKNNEHQILAEVEGIASDVSSMMEELPLLSSGNIIDIFNDNEYVKYTDAFNQQAEIPEEIVEAPREFVGPFGASFFESEKAGANNTVIENNTVSENEEILIPSKLDTEVDSELSRLLLPTEREEIAEKLNSLGMSSELSDSIYDASATPKQVLDMIRAAVELGNDSKLDETAIKSLLSTAGFKKLLADSIKNEWTINPENGFDAEKVRNLYTKVASGSQKLAMALEQAGKGDSPSAVSANSIGQNMQFMNDLNSICQYIQIPLKFGEQTAHGELYVYTNKKKMTSEDGEVSALLHLEMKTLGTMDVHVSLKDREHVNTHFYLDNDEMMTFVADHLEELDASLLKRGYNNNSVASVREKLNGKNNSSDNDNELVSTMLSLNKARVVAKYSFDVRA